MALTILYGALALAALMIGAGALWAAWQVSQLVKHVRQIMLPQANLILTEVQKSLNQVEVLTQEVNSTLEEANQVVHQANRAVTALENGVTTVGHTLTERVAKPLNIRARSYWQGLKVGVAVMRNNSTQTVTLIPPTDQVSTTTEIGSATR